jgi:hypothetical protein
MLVEPVKSNVRTMVGAIFGIFFLANVLLLILSIWTALGSGRGAALLPEDLGSAVKLTIFFVGVAISWFLGRWLFLQMVEGNVGVDESANAAFVMLFYLVLIFTGIAFVTSWSWLWELLLLIVLSLATLFVLRRILSLVIALLIMGGSIAVGLTLFMLFK